ncbi:hypothetical protein [Prosthecobacter sp.]|uniref:hypothetical protein n=1 Tax=Prosthecobacter sp. TaxID=1965333 RepID=UPI00248A8DA1|nr:hypothetical protein [Prosthecobacter sp.]MDI1310673.1 hypothetical protein [Prosthecobacter sp.]
MQHEFSGHIPHTQAHRLNALNEVVQPHTDCGMHEYHLSMPPQTRARVGALLRSSQQC